MEKSEYKKGVMYIILSAFCFALMNMFIKLTGDVPTMQKCFFRNFFAMLIAFATLWKSGVKFKPGKGNIKYLVIRSVTGGLGMMCNFYAVDHMAISDASMLNKLSPFFAVVFSVWIMKEKANRYEWGAVILAFVGSLFVVKPEFNMEAVPAFAGFLGGLGAGVAYAFVRKLGSRGENSMIVVAFFSGFTTLLLTPYLIFNYTPMTAKQWLFLCLTGLAAAGGQIGITSAYSKAPAKEISVYDFSIVIFAAILGYFFIGEVPDYLSVLGYVIIIGTAVAKWYVTVIKPNKNLKEN
ncbi:MAG: DMT family transporter [Oscillospiraceae bacterium]|nr:DMT family transporter [Oscillospiraceae bacterium]